MTDTTLYGQQLPNSAVNESALANQGVLAATTVQAAQQ